MSTDFDVVCDRCRKYRHLGQRSGGGHAFGYGAGDAAGQRAAMAFIDAHFNCLALRVTLSDCLSEASMTPADYAEDDGTGPSGGAVQGAGG
jgi:hypothetical protein